MESVIEVPRPRRRPRAQVGGGEAAARRVQEGEARAERHAASRGPPPACTSSATCTASCPTCCTSPTTRPTVGDEPVRLQRRSRTRPGGRGDARLLAFFLAEDGRGHAQPRNHEDASICSMYGFSTSVAPRTTRRSSTPRRGSTPAAARARRRRGKLADLVGGLFHQHQHTPAGGLDGARAEYVAARRQARRARAGEGARRRRRPARRTTSRSSSHCRVTSRERCRLHANTPPTRKMLRLFRQCSRVLSTRRVTSASE